MPIQFHPLQALTAPEIAAAREYGKDAVWFHAICEGIRFADLGFQSDPHNIVAHMKELDRAVQKFELTIPETFYCGVGRGLPVVGSLHTTTVRQLIGLDYRYDGYISTSESRNKAIQFICTGVKITSDRPVLLTLMLPAGFKGLPMQALGADSTHEGEFLLGRHLSFRIVDAKLLTLADLCGRKDSRDVVELVLEP